MSQTMIEVHSEIDTNLTLEVRVDSESDIWIGGSEFEGDRLLLSTDDARRIAKLLIELADASDLYYAKS